MVTNILLICGIIVVALYVFAEFQKKSRKQIKIEHAQKYQKLLDENEAVMKIIVSNRKSIPLPAYNQIMQIFLGDEGYEIYSRHSRENLFPAIHCCPQCGNDAINKGRVEGKYIDPVHGFERLRYRICDRCGLRGPEVQGNAMIDAVVAWNKFCEEYGSNDVKIPLKECSWPVDCTNWHEAGLFHWKSPDKSYVKLRMKTDKQLTQKEIDEMIKALYQCVLDREEFERKQSND